MDTATQLRVFCLCVLVGVCGGVLYTPFCVIRRFPRLKKKKGRGVWIALDILYCLAFAVLTVYAAYALKFPSFRVYMWGGYLLGGIIYLKILHKTIAFFENIWYNKLSKGIKKAKNRRNTLRKRRTKDYDAR